MNTLVLNIPYNGGALLISDRQSTKADGAIEPWDKIYYLENYNAVIGFSGSSEASRSIAQNLEASAGHDFLEQYVIAYRALHKMDLTSEEKDIEALCIIREESSLRSYKFTRDVCNSIYVSKQPMGIGGGERFIHIMLMGLDTSTYELKSAIYLGIRLIYDASRCDSKVGSPWAHGIRFATVSLDNGIQIATKTAAELPLMHELPLIHEFPLARARPEPVYIPTSRESSRGLDFQLRYMGVDVVDRDPDSLRQFEGVGGVALNYGSFIQRVQVNSINGINIVNYDPVFGIYWLWEYGDESAWYYWDESLDNFVVGQTHP